MLRRLLHSPMRTITVRTAFAHKSRMLLTIVAVVIGTAFITGSLMLTQSMNQSFRDLVDTGVEGVDIGLVGSQQSPEGVPFRVINALQNRSDIRAVNIIGDGPGLPSGTRQAGQSALVVTDAAGIPMQTGSSGAHPMAAYPPGQWVGPEPQLLDGTWPSGDNDVMLNASAARRGHISVGDTITVVTAKSRIAAHVTGIYSLPTDTAGWIGVAFTPEQYLNLFTENNYATQVIISVADPSQVMNVRNSIGLNYRNVTVLTKDQIAEKMSANYPQQLHFITYLLLAFGGIALVVGSALIANTFSMVLGQRRQEFGLLRSIGVPTLQVRFSVWMEALIIGLLGTFAGIVLGIGGTFLIAEVLDNGIISVPVSISTASLVVPALVGLLVSVLGVVPGMVTMMSGSPVALLKEAPAKRAHSWIRTVSGAIVLTAGVAVVIFGALTSAINGTELLTATRLATVGAGTLVLTLGLVLAGPAISVVAMMLLGVAVRWVRVLGVLSTRNTVRNARRTASTALALTMCVGLMACVGVIGATAKTSVLGTVDSNVRTPFVLESAGGSGLALSSSDGSTFAIPEGAEAAARAIPGVAGVATIYRMPLQINQWNVERNTVVDGPIASYVAMGITQGTGAFNGRPGAMISTKYASQSGLKVGDWIKVTPYDASQDLVEADGAAESLAPQAEATVPIIGIYSETSLFGHILVNKAAAELVQPKPGVYLRSLMFVQPDGSVPNETLQEELQQATNEYLVVQVKTKEEFKGSIGTQLNQLLLIIFALLALSVVIASLGIINTLFLAISERRRELGMLRAIGFTRRQVGTLIYVESLQISILGTALGVGLGVFAGWAIVSALRSQGMGEPVWPVPQLLMMAAVAVVVGTVSATLPARSAAHTPPLEAIAER